MKKSNANGSNATIIHMSLQGKGGVGKSLVAAILSQYLASRGQDVESSRQNRGRPDRAENSHE